MDVTDYVGATFVNIFWMLIGVVVFLLGVDHILNPGDALVAGILTSLADFAQFALPEMLTNGISFVAGVLVTLAGVGMVAQYGSELLG